MFQDILTYCTIIIALAITLIKLGSFVKRKVKIQNQVADIQVYKCSGCNMKDSCHKQ